MFPSTEIFSKRRKIYSWLKGNQSDDLRWAHGRQFEGKLYEFACGCGCVHAASEKRRFFYGEHRIRVSTFCERSCSFFQQDCQEYSAAASNSRGVHARPLDILPEHMQTEILTWLPDSNFWRFALQASSGLASSSLSIWQLSIVWRCSSMQCQCFSMQHVVCGGVRSTSTYMYA